MSEREGIARELHRQARKRFPTRSVQLKGIDDLYEADLVEMIPYSDENDGYKYIMTVINCFSKFAYAIPLKRKSAYEVSNALEPILNAKKMKHFHTDEGKEWFNARVGELLKKHGINHYITYSGRKAVFVERFNRTLKCNMWRKFTEMGSYRWVDMLQSLVDDYNGKVHRVIKMRPKDVNEKNERRVLMRLVAARKRNEEAVDEGVRVDESERIPVHKFKEGDKVRVSKYKKIFDKGYLPNWTNEIFTVNKVKPTQPVTYELVDEKGEVIKGGFYNEELQKTAHGDVFLVERVLQRKGTKLLVRWKGFDKSSDSWIDEKDLL